MSINFPVVMKNIRDKHDYTVYIIYRNRAEIFCQNGLIVVNNEYYKGNKDHDKYDPYAEIEMAQNNGCKFVHHKDSLKDVFE